jgi:hypothetical protein
MILFKSKYRKRIEMLIAKDEVELDFITDNMAKIRQTLSPAEHAKYIVAKKEVENELELLKSLL